MMRGLRLPLLLTVSGLWAGEATLTITGIAGKDGVETPALTLNLDDLARMPRVKATVTEGKSTNTYEGALVYEILKRAGQPSSANCARRNSSATRSLSRAPSWRTGWTANRCPPNRGPLRLVLPGERAGARGTYMLERIEIQSAPEPMR